MPLAEATEGVYSAFASHRRRDAIDACPCCVDGEAQDTLARVPLRTLSGAQLSRYAFKAVSTWGEAEDYKHFLPRILELAATDEGHVWPGLDLQVIAKKLRRAGAGSWPQSERDALANYFDALWQTVLAHDPEGRWRANDVLPGIASAVAALSPLLRAWETDRSLTSVLQLADFVDANWADMANRGHLQGRWREVAAREGMERWLTDPARRQALEEAFERHLEDRPGRRRSAP